MTTEFLMSKYGMTVLEANVFLFWNLKGFVAEGMDVVIIRALNKVGGK